MENTKQQPTIQLDWKGPFILLGTQGDQFFKSVIAEQSGIYLFTVEYDNGYLIYMAGWTTRPFKKRIKEHIREYRKGTYTLFDTEALQNGQRREIWHGMWTRKSTNTPEMKALFLSRRQEFEPAIERLLCTFRVFFAPLETERRILARIEGAIMHILYSEVAPVSAIPDRGMALAPRWETEDPLVAQNFFPVHIHGLPQSFEI